MHIEIIESLYNVLLNAKAKLSYKVTDWRFNSYTGSGVFGSQYKTVGERSSEITSSVYQTMLLTPQQQ